MNRRKGRRGLTSEEKELWQKVAKGATPLHKSRPAEMAPEIPEKFIVAPEPFARPVIPTFRVGQNPVAPTAPRPAPKTAQIHMDHKAYGQMKRGKLKPEAKIDLHGMTQNRAHGILTTFIQDGFSRGLRLVLVVTGKGKDRDDGGPIPTPRGVLRHNVPRWLASAPLSAMVLQVAQANLRHGGEGAYYVYLKRRR